MSMSYNVNSKWELNQTEWPTYVAQPGSNRTGGAYKRNASSQSKANKFGAKRGKHVPSLLNLQPNVTHQQQDWLSQQSSTSQHHQQSSGPYQQASRGFQQQLLRYQQQSRDYQHEPQVSQQLSPGYRQRSQGYQPQLLSHQQQSQGYQQRLQGYQLQSQDYPHQSQGYQQPSQGYQQSHAKHMFSSVTNFSPIGEPSDHNLSFRSNNSGMVNVADFAGNIAPQRPSWNSKFPNFDRSISQATGSAQVLQQVEFGHNYANRDVAGRVKTLRAGRSKVASVTPLLDLVTPSSQAEIRGSTSIPRGRAISRMQGIGFRMHDSRFSSRLHSGATVARPDAGGSSTRTSAGRLALRAARGGETNFGGQGDGVRSLVPRWSSTRMTSRKRPLGGAKNLERNVKPRRSGEVSVTISSVPKPDGTGVDDQIFFCPLCKVTLRKQQNYQQHLAGRRHKKRVEETTNATEQKVAETAQETKPVTDVKEMQPGMNSSAELPETSQVKTQQEQHTASADVKDGLQTDRMEDGPSDVGGAQQGGAQAIAEQSVKKALTDSPDGQQPSLAVSSEVVPQAADMQPEVKVEAKMPAHLVKWDLTRIPTDPDKVNQFCLICRVALLDAFNKRCHEATPSHIQRAAKQLELQSGLADGQTLCSVCMVAYPKSEEAEHLASDEHDKASHYRLASCEICSVKHNLQDSLKGHLTSYTHRTAAAKLLTKDNAALRKHFEELAVNQNVRRLSFCVICTMAVGSIENMRLHNILYSDHHARINLLAQKAKPDQFFCYCCETVVNVNNKKHHSRTHRKRQQMQMRWRCEECGMLCAAEEMLIHHLTTKLHLEQEAKRKKIEKALRDSLTKEWNSEQKQHQIKAAEMFIAKSEAPSQQVVPSDIVNECSDVITMAGWYCKLCRDFFPFDTPAILQCEHIHPRVEAPCAADATAEPSLTAAHGVDETEVEASQGSAAAEPNVPEPTVPEPTVLKPTVLDAAVREQTVPEAAVPEAAVPEPTVPEATVPEPTVLKPAALEAAVAEPTVLDPTVLKPTVPEPAAQEPTVPEPIAPTCSATDSEHTSAAMDTTITADHRLPHGALSLAELDNGVNGDIATVNTSDVSIGAPSSV